MKRIVNVTAKRVFLTVGPEDTRNIAPRKDILLSDAEFEEVREDVQRQVNAKLVNVMDIIEDDEEYLDTSDNDNDEDNNDNNEDNNDEDEDADEDEDEDEEDEDEEDEDEDEDEDDDEDEDEDDEDIDMDEDADGLEYRTMAELKAYVSENGIEGVKFGRGFTKTKVIEQIRNLKGSNS